MNLLIIFCSSPGRASRRYCPETRGKRAPIPGAPRIDTIFPPGGPEEVCSQSDPLGGTEGSNLSPSSGESRSSRHSHREGRGGTPHTRVTKSDTDHGSSLEWVIGHLRHHGAAND